MNTNMDTNAVAVRAVTMLVLASVVLVAAIHHFGWLEGTGVFAAVALLTPPTR